MKASERTTAQALLAACLIGGLVAPAHAAKKTTLVVWAPVESQFRVVSDRFEKEHPGVKVQIQSGAMDKFYTMITAGLMPDLWGPWATPGIRADVNRNWAVELTPYIKRDAKEIDINDFFPGIMRNFRINGKQYSLPIFSYVDYFYYNTKLYAEAGLNPPPVDANDRSWNWDRMVANAQKMTRRDASGKMLVAGIEVNTVEQWEPSWMHMWGGAEYGEETLKSSVPQQVYWTSPGTVKALTKAWELINKFQVARPTNGAFSGGKTGASMDNGPWVTTFMRTKSLKWAVAPLPWGETNSGTLYPDGWRIGKVSRNKELAWEYIKFMCRPDNMKYMVSDPKSIRYGSPAARKSVFAETLGQDIGRVTGMDPRDVRSIQAAADEVGQVKLQELVCIHWDLVPFWEPIFQSLWQNKVSPSQAAQKLQDISSRQLPILFKRWVRNIEFTGTEKKR